MLLALWRAIISPRDAIGDGVHDRPLRRGEIPAALCFASRQFNDARSAEVHVEFSVGDEDARPDDLAGFGNAFEGAAAEPEIHGGLALAARAAPAVDEMGRRGRAGDEKDPDIIGHGAGAIDV